MEEEARKVLERELHDLAATFHGVLEWKWDGRFGTVLAEFSLENKAAVLEILDRYVGLSMGQRDDWGGPGDREPGGETSWRAHVRLAPASLRPRRRCAHLLRLVAVGERTDDLDSNRSLQRQQA